MNADMGSRTERDAERWARAHAPQAEMPEWSDRDLSAPEADVWRRRQAARVAAASGPTREQVAS